MASAQDVKVLASVDPQAVEVGQSFDYTLRITTAGRTRLAITAQPDFGAMSVAGTSQGTEFRSVNGQSRLVQSLRYQVIATAAGDFVIAGAKVQAGDAVIAVDPVKVTVFARGAAPASVASSARDPIFLRAIASEMSPYVGQQVLLEYAIYLDERRMNTLGIDVRNMEEPPFDGFWIEDLSEAVRDNQRREVIDGKEWAVRVVRLQAIFPLKAGRIAVEPVKMDLQMSGFSLMRSRTAKIESEQLELNVRPLPPGAPKGFDPSNVGQYQLTVTTDKPRVAVGEALTVRVSVSGLGMVGRVELPSLPAIDGVRMLDPVFDKALQKTDRNIRGTRTAEIVLTPTKEGTFEVPPVDFHAFDPKKGSYVTSRSRPIKVFVVGTGRAVEGEVEVAQRTDVEQPELLKRASQPLESLRPLPVIEAPVAPAPLWTRWWVWLGLLAPPLGFSGWLAYGRVSARREESVPERRKKGALRAAEARLAEARGLSGAALYGELPGVLTEFMAIRLEVPPGRLSGERLGSTLSGRGVESEVIERLVGLRSECDAGRFAGETPRSREALVAETEALLKALGRVL